MKKMFVKKAASFILCAGVVCSMLAAPVSAKKVFTYTHGTSGNSRASSYSGNDIPVSLIEQYAKNSKYKVPQAFLSEIKGAGSITRSQLKGYADKHRLSSEFLQLFFPDHFVFRVGNVYKYTPVNDNLAKNSYDWDYLKSAGGNEKRYSKDGLTADKGIDVSRYQGDINWKKVKQDGVDFAIIRLGYRGYSTGKIVLDEKFHQNMQGAKAAGIPVGVYFYSQAVSTREARQEAQFVIDNLDGYEIDYPVVFDIEAAPSAYARTANLSATAATDIAIAFCDAVESAGYDSMIYSYLYYFVHNMQLSRLERFDKWVANYYDVPYFPYKFQILQYTSEGKVNGISGNTDMNLGFVKY